jgi:hypothetical protein
LGILWRKNIKKSYLYFGWHLQLIMYMRNL